MPEGTDPQATTHSSEPVLDQSESVAATNLKVIGDGPAVYTNLAYGNAVSHQQSMNAIAAAATGNIVRNLTEVDPMQAISVLKATSGNDLAQQLGALLAALSSNQIGAKVAGATPPPTP